MNIRPALATDLDAILAIDRSVDHAPHWSRTTYVEILAAGSSRTIFVAEDEARILISGYAVAHLADHGMSLMGELESVVVAQASRRHGIGRQLCLAVLDWCRQRGASEIELEVRASSRPAVALYQSLQFNPIGRRPRYYRDPEDDGLLMSRNLAGTSALAPEIVKG